MKRTVLLTNYQMVGYSGSELDTLNIANYFLEHSYDVTIFTFKYGYPLLGDIDERIKIVTSKNIGDMIRKYDIIWAHHFPLLDYLLFFQKISADYIHYVSLSSFSDYECLPEYYKKINLNSILSYEGKATLEKEKYDISNINVFTNYSVQKCFTYKIKKHKLDKICIISNHIPNEVLDFVHIFKEREEKKIDIFGKKHKYIKVTKDLLSSYDLVITIGRTVNDALAIGIPVYCYDRFGGDGYLNINNVEDSYKYNFSGRFSHKKKSGLELYEDIINNYSKCLKDLPKLREFARENFCFEDMMSKVIKKLRRTKKFSLKKTIEENPHLLRKAPLFYNRLNDEIIELNKYKNYVYNPKIYFNLGYGYSEKKSIQKRYYIQNNTHIFKVKIPKNVKKIRFDFSDVKYTVIKNLYINGHKLKKYKCINCVKMEDESIISINDDPNITFKNNNYKSLNISLNLEILSPEEFLKTLYKSKKLYKKTKPHKKIKELFHIRKEKKYDQKIF